MEEGQDLPSNAASNTTVLMFSGQASQYPGMLERAVSKWPDGVHTCARASEVLGWDVLKHYREENQSCLESNEHVQIGVFVCDYLYLEALRSLGLQTDWSLGLSLGEYCHLVHIGALSFEDALHLVQARGRIYDEQSGGMMLSVFPIQHWELERIVERSEEYGRIEISNINSDSQFVLSGEQPAIEEAQRIIEQETFVTTHLISDRLAMHSSCFLTAARTFRPYLVDTVWRPARLPYLPNMLGKPLTDPRPEDFQTLLERHLVKPVLWRDSIAHLMDRLEAPIFLEVGPKGVLAGLVKKIKTGGNSFKCDGDIPLADVVKAVCAHV